MSRFLSAALLLAGLFALTAVHPVAQPQTPPFITCRNGGIIWQDPLVSTAQMTQHCIDPAYFMRSVFTGIACNPPGTGLIVYAQLPDKSCLNLVAVQANGTSTPAIVRVDPTLGLTFWVRLTGIGAKVP